MSGERNHTDDAHASSETRVLVDIETLHKPYALLDAVRDPDGRVVDFIFRAVNEAAVEDYALPREVLIGSSLLGLDPLTGDAVIFDGLVEVVTSGEPWILQDLEYRDAPPDGRTMYYDVTATKIGDGIGIAWSDVTSRYAKDREVARAERETRAIVESLLDPLAVFEPIRNDAGFIVDVRCVRVNDAFCRYLDTTRERLEGLRLLQRYRGEGIEVLVAWCRHILITGQPVVLDAFSLAIPGRGRRVFDVRGVQLEGLVSVTFRDVSDRERVAAEMAEATRRYRLVAENAGEMVFQTGTNGTVEWVSPSAQWVLGWSPEQLIGRSLAELIHPDDLLMGRVEQDRTMAAGASEGRAEVRMINAQGEFRWMSVMGKAILDDEGNLLGGVESVRDIQASKDAQLRLMESEERFRRAMDDASIGMAIVAANGAYIRVNPAMSQILHRTREQLLASTWQDLTHPDDLDVDQHLADEVLRGVRDTYRLAKRYLTPDGEVVWTDLAVSCVRDSEGDVAYYLSQIIDITESVTAREALASSEEHYRLIAENSLDVVFRAEPAGRILWISPSVTEVLGWRPDEVVDKQVLEFLRPSDIPAVAYDPSYSERLEFEGRVRQSDGGWRWVDVRSQPVFDADGELVSRVGRLRDIAGKKQAEEALRRSEEMFRTAMESAPTGMAVVGLDRRFLQVNTALCRLLGRNESWLLRHGLADVMDPVDNDIDEHLRSQILAGAEPSLTADHQMIRADGRRVLVEQSVGLLDDGSGRPSGYVSQFVDVTESRRARDQLRFMATHDSLTELLNRRELLVQVTGILGQTPRTGRNVGILFVDLDHLKPINDSYGHAVGDQVIVTVATRIREQLRTSDLVARFGGDEFVVVLPAVHTPDDVSRIATMLHTAVRQPITVGDVRINTSVSIGAVMVPPGSDPGDALRVADKALYQAKRDGRDRTVHFGVDGAGSHS